MNPLLFKAHPLLTLTLGLVLEPGSHGLMDWLAAASIYLGVNLPWTYVLVRVLRRQCRLTLPLPTAFGFALVSLVVYLPIMLTLVNDVLHHSFKLVDRFIFLFTLFIGVQMIAVIYGFLLRYPRSRVAIGLTDGFVVSLAMLLSSMIACAVFLSLFSFN